MARPGIDVGSTSLDHPAFSLGVLDALEAHIAVLDGDGVVVAVNEAWRRFARANGGAPEAYLGWNYLAVCDARADDEGAAAAAREIRSLLGGERQAFALEYPCHGPCEQRWFLVRGSLFSFREHRTVVVAHEDVTARRLAENALRASEITLRRVLETMPVGVWIMDAEGRIVHGNPAGVAIWAGARYVGPERFGEYKGWWLATGQPIAADEWAATRAIRYGETSIDEEIEIECFDGSRKIILNSALPLHDEDGAIAGAIIVNQDITDRKRVESALKLSEQKWHTLFELLPVGVSVLDQHHEIVDSNPALAEILRLSPASFGSGAFRRRRFLHRNEAPLAAEELPSARAIREQTAIRDVEVTVVDEQGGRIWTSVSAAPLPFPDARAVVVVNDVTPRVQAEEDLRRAKAALEATNAELERMLEGEKARARTDFLTGALSRRHFFDLADRQLAVSARYCRPLSLILLDIDHFKQINDTRGHGVGDEVLRRVAKAASDCLRESDIFARHGGDEFVALLPHTHAGSALTAAEHILEAIARLRIETEQGSIGVTLSAGVAATVNPGDTIDRLVHRADQALYAAKGHGRNRAVVFARD